MMAFLIAMLSVFFVQPSVAKVALAKNFVAEPEDRFPGLPLLSLGGVSMFIGINLSISLVSTKAGFVSMHDVIAALIVMLFSGFLLDTNMAARYFRLAVKLLAAFLVVLRFHEGPSPLFTTLPLALDVVLQLVFMVGFMFGYHYVTVFHKTLFHLLAMVNGLLLGFLHWNIESQQQWALLGFALGGSLCGILLYSRYAMRKQKPLPLIGHTGIFLTGLILASLWLTYFKAII